MAGSDISTPSEPKVRVWRMLYNRNYALLFCGQFVSTIGTQIQIVAVAWQVYLLTHSAVALGIIGLLQAVPRIIFSTSRNDFGTFVCYNNAQVDLATICSW